MSETKIKSKLFTMLQSLSQRGSVPLYHLCLKKIHLNLYKIASHVSLLFVFEVWKTPKI